MGKGVPYSTWPTRWHNPPPLVRIILQLHLSSLCAPIAVVVLCTASCASVACEAWKMLDVYKPMIWATYTSSNSYLRQITFCLFFKNLPQIHTSVFFGGKYISEKQTFANTPIHPSNPRMSYYYGARGTYAYQLSVPRCIAPIHNTTTLLASSAGF